MYSYPVNLTELLSTFVEMICNGLNIVVNGIEHLLQSRFASFCSYLKKICCNEMKCYLPIVFGSSWYGGIPQWAGGGVANGSPTPLWQKKLGKPILLACKNRKEIIIKYHLYASKENYTRKLPLKNMHSTHVERKR